MSETFRLRIEEIQPSQLYISSEKLTSVMKIIEEGKQDELEPIPIKILDDETVSTDGHTRLYAWFLKGEIEVECEWEDLEMDWEAYRICVEWCKGVGITSASDFDGRVLAGDDYQKLWLDRCRVMQEELEAEREKQ